MRVGNRSVNWGDDHVQHSGVVNYTHVQTAGPDRVVMRFWHLVVLVCLVTTGLGSLVALVVLR